MNTVKFFTHNGAKPPTRATDGAAGWDLYAPHTFTLSPYFDGATRRHHTVDTLVTVEIPAGHVGQVYPRSSLGVRGLFLLNTTGIIDSDYDGHIILKLGNHSAHDLTINEGERFAQIIFTPCLTTAEHTTGGHAQRGTGRGTGGFGSTGK